MDKVRRSAQIQGMYHIFLQHLKGKRNLTVSSKSKEVMIKLIWLQIFQSKQFFWKVQVMLCRTDKYFLQKLLQKLHCQLRLQNGSGDTFHVWEASLKNHTTFLREWEHVETFTTTSWNRWSNSLENFDVRMKRIWNTVKWTVDDWKTFQQYSIWKLSRWKISNPLHEISSWPLRKK